MSASASYAIEALIGPSSHPISPSGFIQRCLSHSSSAARYAHRATSWSDLSNETKRAIERECSVADLESSLNQTLSSPFQYSFLIRSHEDAIHSIRAAPPKPADASSPSQTLNPPKSSNRKRKRISKLPSSGTCGEIPTQWNSEVQQLRNNLERIALSCWSYPPDAAFVTRPPKNSDLNTLTKPKASCSSQDRTSPSSSAHPHPQGETDAILVISIYNRLSWGNHLSRSSQHVVLASQTLGDLYDVIPCPSNEIPSEDDDNSADFVSPPHRGAVVCIEGVVYGDGMAEVDYSDKLLKQIELLPEKKRPHLTKGTCMYDQRFADLSLRVNQAYWLLHQGSCEHFLVVDSIRMLHPTDPPSSYPLTTHIAPPIIDLCMSCSRVPAALSIVNDIRLGQTPFKICKSCWSHFGEPTAQDREGVLVVSLPKYEHGW
ncbi:uncharacterized protein FOMMEDRAFT_156180 [Fomitiporia mediterranea MF3/22]|uniref:uncharacterized protein n=1 Tax=Fomitiporia mediterranea (strain MF3/22) TaxID=694068 RepID=UPI0004408204|nr:uncharacterized protein FOMMEDRAFT_156180 [Fomitiporia mediterranea MF3/22]EJD02827.1 hypothetical protein FOMMEDRAFT_156180 [Fomitiporia mediterranea MF3/22]